MQLQLNDAWYNMFYNLYINFTDWVHIGTFQKHLLLEFSLYEQELAFFFFKTKNYLIFGVLHSYFLVAVLRFNLLNVNYLIFRLDITSINIYGKPTYYENTAGSFICVGGTYSTAAYTTSASTSHNTSLLFIKKKSHCMDCNYKVYNLHSWVEYEVGQLGSAQCLFYSWWEPKVPLPLNEDCSSQWSVTAFHYLCCGLLSTPRNVNGHYLLKRCHCATECWCHLSFFVC